MDYSEKVAKKILTYLETSDGTYQFDPESGLIVYYPKVSKLLEGTHLIIAIYNTFYTVYGYYGLDAEEYARDEVAKFITRVNHGQWLGNFDMDYDDGEIRYKVCIDFEDSIPTFDTIKNSIMLPVLELDRCRVALTSLIFCLKTAEEAFEEIEDDE